MKDYFETSTREAEYLRLWQPRKKILPIGRSSKNEKEIQFTGSTIDKEQQEIIRQLIKAVVTKMNTDRPPTHSVLAKVKIKFKFRSYKNIPLSQYDEIIEYLNKWKQT